MRRPASIFKSGRRPHGPGCMTESAWISLVAILRLAYDTRIIPFPAPWLE